MKALKCWTLADHSNRSVIVLHMQALEMFWWCKIDWWKQVVKVLTTDWDTDILRVEEPEETLRNTTEFSTCACYKTLQLLRSSGNTQTHTQTNYYTNPLPMLGLLRNNMLSIKWKVWGQHMSIKICKHSSIVNNEFP